MAYYPYQNPYQMYPYQQQPVYQTPTTTGIIWVSGLAEASAFPISPNNAVALWEKSGKTVYLKSADATGKPNLIVYDLVEHKEGTQQTESPTFATKDEFTSFANGIDEIINTLKSDIDTMKSDIYGIAGKKKVKIKDE